MLCGWWADNIVPSRLMYICCFPTHDWLRFEMQNRWIQWENSRKIKVFKLLWNVFRKQIRFSVMKSGTRKTKPRRGAASVVNEFLRLFSVSSCPKITHLFLLDLIKTYTIMHQTQRSRLHCISSVFHMKNLQDAGQCFLLDKSCRKMYMIFVRGATSTEEKRRHDVFWSHRSQRRLLWSSFPLAWHLEVRWLFCKTKTPVHLPIFVGMTRSCAAGRPV
jgi:hypothetical protein